MKASCLQLIHILRSLHIWACVRLRIIIWRQTGTMISEYAFWIPKAKGSVDIGFSTQFTKWIGNGGGRVLLMNWLRTSVAKQPKSMAPESSSAAIPIIRYLSRSPILTGDVSCSMSGIWTAVTLQGLSLPATGHCGGDGLTAKEGSLPLC